MPSVKAWTCTIFFSKLDSTLGSWREFDRRDDAKGRFQKKVRNFPHFSGVGGFESHFPQKI